MTALLEIVNKVTDTTEFNRQVETGIVISTQDDLKKMESITDRLLHWTPG